MKIKLFLASLMLVATASADDFSIISQVNEISRLVRGGQLNQLGNEQKAALSQSLNEAYMILTNLGPGPTQSVICVSTGNGEYYQMIDANTGYKIGGQVWTLDKCKKSLPAAGQNYVCASAGNSEYYQLINIRAQKNIGGQVWTIEKCFQSLPSVNQTMYCASTGNSEYYQLYTKNNDAPIGAPVWTIEKCKAQIP